MNRRTIEVALGLIGLVAAVWLWHTGIRPGDYASPGEGYPAYTSNFYDGTHIGGAVAVATIAVVLLIDALRPARPPRYPM